MTTLRTLMLSLLLFSSVAVASMMKTYTVPTQHQLPEQLIPLVQPLLVEGGVVTHFSNHLIIKTTPENYQEIEVLLRQFDQPAQQLLISLRSPSQRNSEHRDLGVTGTITAGDGSIQIGDGRVPDGGIRIGKDEDQAYYRYGTRSSSSEGVRQVRTLEGSTALITTGVEVPKRRWGVGGNGYHDDGYKKVEQGFYVTARLVGNGEAIIEIAAQNDQLSPQHPRRIETQEANTQIRAPVGQWVRFGGLDTQENSQNREIGGRSYSAGNRSGYFEIMVEAL